MLAMQYSIQLPGDYDRQRICERVSVRSKLFDGHNGLVHKSFLYNDADKVYAPFYIWKDLNEAQNFLLDDLFHGVVQTFNRCRVRSWFTVSMAYANRDVKATYALKETDIVPPEEKLDAYMEKDRREQEALLANSNLYMHLIALDADRWEIVRFSLWKDKAGAVRSHSDSYEDYEVLHVSEPASFS